MDVGHRQSPATSVIHIRVSSLAVNSDFGGTSYLWKGLEILLLVCATKVRGISPLAATKVRSFCHQSPNVRLWTTSPIGNSATTVRRDYVHNSSEPYLDHSTIFEV